MKQKSEVCASSASQLLSLIQEQKRMNQEIVNRLEAINSAPPLSSEIRYLKVLLNSSSTHILNSMIEAAKHISRTER
ncbi:hypothetical protein [Bacillus haynesii]|uniref:hypothetical protein n=1 Tax=Bacillus haynesii TaxID=1925021 RepID=UPI002280F996|nr:hypothetical protein [Bacillus haynesii]MCY8066160.1 hypothetical protein [Bacillus haynesii]MCY9215511.1 hypothetical protein [Bacillus haynesii]MCY9262201.1 hypothetical protein [Bacillus haynesii]MCY9370502.1 hypothetical protein [Bacillus haynesii]MCY9445702.1 hypothetical protein [Bacillus haynesii]